MLVSDTHFDSHDTLLADNWSAAERWIGVIRPDHVIHLGDICANGAHHDGELSHARDVLRGSPVDIHFLPGNHDIGDHVAGPGLSTDEPFDLGRLAEFRSLFGPDWWSIDLGAWRLIGLNAPLMATGLVEEEIQMQWLRSILELHEGPIGLFLHKPMFRNTPEDVEVHTRYVPHAARIRLLDAFAQKDLRFIAAGHTHQLRRITHDGVEHVWVPSTAFTNPDSLQERIGDKVVGIMTLELSGDSHRFEHFVPEGMLPTNLFDLEHIYPALTAIKRSLQT